MKKGQIHLDLGIKLPEAFTTEENFEYARRYIAGDKDAREQLIIHNLKSVVKIVNCYYNQIKCDYEDMLFAGIEGLIRSVDKYNPSFNVPFYSFAKRGIMNQITLFLRNELNELFGGEVVSLYEPVQKDNQGNSYDRIDVLQNNDESFEEQVIDSMIADDIKKVIEELPIKYKQPIILYYGLEGNNPYTQTEASKIIGISRQETNKRIRKATNMIKKELSTQYDDVISLEMKIS